MDRNVCGDLFRMGTGRSGTHEQQGIGRLIESEHGELQVGFTPELKGKTTIYELMSVDDDALGERVERKERAV